MTPPSNATESIIASEPGTAEITSATDRYRSHTVERGACTLLRDAALTFDGLVAVARRHRVLDDRAVRRSLGRVVHTIAASIRSSTTTPATSPLEPGPTADVGSVLIERAAARFSTRVLGTEAGLRPCPADVLAAIRDARRTLVAAAPVLGDRAGGDADRATDPATVVVVYGLLRDRAALEPVLRALAPRASMPIHLVGTSVPVRVDDARTILDLEYGSGPAVGTDARLAGAHLGWIGRQLSDAGHRVASTAVATGSLAAHVEQLVTSGAGNGTDPQASDSDHAALVVTVGPFAAVRTWGLRRRLERAGASVVVAGRRAKPLPDGRPAVGE